MKNVSHEREGSFFFLRRERRFQRVPSDVQFDHEPKMMPRHVFEDDNKH